MRQKALQIELGGEFVLVLHHAAGVVDDLGHRRIVERPRTLRFGPICDEAGVPGYVIPRPLHDHVEIGAYLEEPAELLVVRPEGMKQGCVAHQYHLDVYWNWLRSDGAGDCLKPSMFSTMSDRTWSR